MHPIAFGLEFTRRHRRSRFTAVLFLMLFVVAGAAPLAFAVPAIPNPSFEANAAFASTPGTIVWNAPIVGWTTNETNLAGLNPAGGLDFHADNGLVPHGSRVAFLQSEAGISSTLSTTMTGLVAGRHYRVRFHFNCKYGFVPTKAFCQIEGGGVTSLIVPESVDVAGVHAHPYRTCTALFLATKPTARLEIGNRTEFQSTLLVDNFLITEATPIQVTNANNDGPGSLRQAIATAAATPAFNVITFAPALSGQTIRLRSELRIFNDNSGVAIDALSLPRGITVSPDSGSGNHGNFEIWFQPAHLAGLTISGGRTPFGAGVYVSANANVLMTRCTMQWNGASITQSGGGIFVAGTATLSQCTIAGNFASQGGCGIYIAEGGNAALNHCTVGRNDTNNVPGGGIYNCGQLTLTNCIVASNVVTFGSDIYGSGPTAQLTLFGANNIPLLDIEPGSASGPGVLLPAPAQLEHLRENGGPTQTMALAPASPARNASVASAVTMDQRGRTVQGAPDLGAYEVQRGTFVFPNPVSWLESAGSFYLTVIRTDGFESAVSVNVSAIAGTAGPADFSPFSNRTVSFSDGQTAAYALVDVVTDSLVEANETFTLVLSVPSAGTKLGTLSTISATLVDGSSADPGADTVVPGAPVFTSPAAGSFINPSGNWFVVTGTATDNKGVAEVRVRCTYANGSVRGFYTATLSKPGATSTPWTITFPTDVPGVLVIEAEARDGAGNPPSPLALRTVKVLSPLDVAIIGNGSVTPAGFTPGSFREVGAIHTLTAVPAPGWMFLGWGPSVPAAQIGAAAVALSRPTLTFIHVANLRLTAQFAPSPYNSNLTGNYRGLLIPSPSVPVGGTRSSNSTEGAFNATLTTTGALSGTVTIDGLVRSFAGALDYAGVARFGTSRADKLLIPRPFKPSLELAFQMETEPPLFYPRLLGQIRELTFPNSVVAQSDLVATRAHYNGTSFVVPTPLVNNGTSAVYNLILPPPPDLPGYYYSTPFPYGAGFGRMTLTKGGRVTLTDCTLADGTIGVTASSFLDDSNSAVFFIPLYGKGGFLRFRMNFISGDLQMDGFSDFGKWCRPPIVTSHYYPAGWPMGIGVGVRAAIYTVPIGRSVLSGGSVPLGPPDADGNVRMNFVLGQLSETLSKAVNISSTDAVTKLPANNPTFSLSINRATGLFSGTFTHTDTTVVPFKGIIQQKSIFGPWGHGFFLTTKPTPIDYSGESGQMSFEITP